MTDLTNLGVKAIRDGVAGGDFTAREVAEAFNAAVAQAAWEYFQRCSSAYARTCMDPSFSGLAADFGPLRPAP